ncbi:MAG: tRNA (N(6)-L-threonylcarbamoyladenosine(37)-C(2))-methylthiotransferase MtaB [Ruminococcaceae bacterium]|jgi:threonylcarbamoyladenosine tRNA methylthiotransferase MtaB|nr:tRNA (N(6)-L-threonylcarbamoyladenosine(37)-C(2))-methylthiotransferase MtaB [Oscillospiraceae bacterium]
MEQKKTAAFHTLGCKTNHYETDAIRMQFAAAGFDLVEFREPADVYIINTCSVTAEADRKSRQMLRRARQVNPKALVVAVGCQAVIGDAAKWADLVVDNDHKSQTCRMVLSCLAGEKAGQRETDEPPHYDELGCIDRQSETRAYLKIEDGCDQFCTYCAIPLARGRVRSRGRKQIVTEARALALAGYKEVVLTGIHLCSFGKDHGLPGHTVMELALELADIEGIERIRLGSLEPRFLTDRFVELAASNPYLCPHFHLSLQSGSDKILRSMRRSYQTDQFRESVAALRQAFADPGLTTDMIVGFPGETEDEFADSLAFCREMAFSRIHVFRFSARAGTAAARMPDVVPAGEKTRRSHEMNQLAQDLSGAYHAKQVGHTHAVLVEQQLGNDLYSGYTPEYVPVHFHAARQQRPGDIVQVKGLQAKPEILLGAQT